MGYYFTIPSQGRELNIICLMMGYYSPKGGNRTRLASVVGFN